MANTAIPIDRIESEFVKATGQKIGDYFVLKEGELLEFLKNRPRMFQIEEIPGRKTKIVLPLEYCVSSEFKLDEVP